jgi:uncharacterized ferritin-like protein (DUF455 family)
VSDCLAKVAAQVLLTAEAKAKAVRSRQEAERWRSGVLTADAWVAMPDRPARPPNPPLLRANQLPKRGRGGTLANRIALLHALAHIELNAVDLAWDMVGRFGFGQPQAFLDDWIGVADDESRHFLLLADRLEALGSHYGALPAHDGLWEAAQSTADDLLARLAVVPMVLEARGLDVTPQTVERLRQHGDVESAEILTIIYTDEISHVACGVRWFTTLCARGDRNVKETFDSAVNTHFRGKLKPPFNDVARTLAQLPKELYASLASA